MKTSKNNLVAILAIAASLLAASTAMAGGKKGNGNTSGGVGRPKPTLNSVNLANKYGESTTVLGNGTTKNENIAAGQRFGNGDGKAFGNVNGLNNAINTINNRGINVTIVLGGTVKQSPPPKSCKPCRDGNWYCGHQCDYTWNGSTCEVFYGEYVVLPCDTFETIAMKVYGTNANILFLAQFNHLPVNAALVPGQVLMIPSI